MRSIPRRLLPSLLLLLASSALAQPNQRVRDLNRQASEAYQQLDIERAESLLETARRECEATMCPAQDRARTLANLGIVAFGGAGDSARALDLFRQAVTADPTVRLDPLLSTPDTDLLFQRARAEAAASSTEGSGGVTLRHVPPPEQLVHTALPLYVEVPDGVNVARIELHYLGNGMRRYAVLATQPMVDGFGVELACEHVFAPSIAYYFVALDTQGRTVRTVGSEAQPFRVPVVTNRTQSPPALPGRSPPEACNLAECPPGMDCGTPDPAETTVGLGGACTSATTCAAGLTCTNHTCSTSADSASGSSSGDGTWMRYWVEAGAELTMGTGHDGLRAADSPTLSAGAIDPQLDALQENDSYLLGGTNGCAASNPYCVRVTENGSAFAWGLHLGAGMWLTERIGLGLNVRLAPQSGGGTLSHAQMGLRLQYRIIVPRPTGLWLSAHIGGSVGQVQVRPKQEPTTPGGAITRPWAQTGLGGVQVGGTVGYHFSRSVGVFFTPEFYALFPASSLGGNFIVGMDFAFGERGGTPPPAAEPTRPPPVTGPADSDRDGIPDPSDQCPTEAEDVDGFQDADGCPDLDDDADGIPDTYDSCRTEAEDMDSFEDENGCPDPDNDADTVLDGSDRCPLQAGPAANQGCPDPDRDSDTVPDRIDNCPDEAGSPENRGCRVQQLVVIEGDHLEILDKVYFRTNSHVIDRRSYPLLLNIAAVVAAHPEIQSVSVEGHTDERGNAVRNRALSQRRAASVRTYLTQHGIDASRVTAQGFGPDHPVFPGATTEVEHEANRRVEFRLTMQQ